MVDAGAQGSMGMAQSVIWESQQKDIMKHMKESYGAQGQADNKTFDINQQLPNGNRLSEERAEDWDVRALININCFASYDSIYSR